MQPEGPEGKNTASAHVQSFRAQGLNSPVGEPAHGIVAGQGEESGHCQVVSLARETQGIK